MTDKTEAGLVPYSGPKGRTVPDLATCLPCRTSISRERKSFCA